MELVDIEQINFGKVDGKTEAQSNDFEELFYDDGGHYKKIKDNIFFIILGRKGSGKTTLANYFRKKVEKEKNKYAKMLYATDFQNKKLLAFSNDPVNQEEMTVFWKYIFLKEFGELIVEKSSKRFISKFYKSKKLKKLEELLENVQFNIDSVTDNHQTKYDGNGTVGASEKGINIGASASIQKINGGSRSLKKKKYYDEINELERIVLKLLKSKKEHYIIYDDMDQLEETMDKEKFLKLMLAMFYAAENFNIELREANINSKILLVMRSDIIKILHDRSNNLNKMISDYGIEIKWFSPNVLRPLKHPLMKMVLHKIKNSVDTYKDVPIDELFKNIFDGDENILDYFMKHGLGRPRDIISFLNIVKETFPTVKKITQKELQECLSLYSEVFYNELMNEIKIDEEAKQIKEVLKLLQKRGSKKGKFNKINNYYESNSDEYEIENLLHTLQRMYELGIVGIMKYNGKMEFSYRENLVSMPNEKSQFVLHYGLHRYLAV